MIPNRLRLQNFMCYRAEQELDFSGIHLACLTGDNGHGKSTLLDAMTWALWGRARARRDDELITLGENEMWVDFEFSLGSQRYRVWRQRSKRGRGQSDLHLYIWNAAAEDWQLLDDGNLNERQAQIIRTLRLDYDTFVNSAFLLQGRADSFTVKTAGERKQILADILGLERYDRYEERAKDEARVRKDQAERIQGEVDAIDRELARRVVYEAQLETARAGVQSAGLACRTAEADQARARLAVQSLEDQERQLADLRTRLGRAERDLNEGQTQLAAARARLAEFEAVLAQRGEIEEGWGKLQAAREQDTEWNTRLFKHTQIQEQLNRVRLALSQARSALEVEQRHLAGRESDLVRRVGAAENQKVALAQAQAGLERFAVLEARREALAGELHAAAEKLGALKVANDQIKSEGQELKEKVEMLGEAETAACPLCGQPLDAGHRQEMLAGLNAGKDQLAQRFRANQAEMKSLAERQEALKAEDLDLVRDLRAKDLLQRKAAQAEAAINDGESAATELAQARERQTVLAARLAAEDYAPEEQAKLGRLEDELAQVGYDAAAHQASKAEVERWQPFDTRYQRQLMVAIDGIEEARERVTTLAGQIERRAAELAEDRAQAARLEVAVVGLPGLRQAQAQADAALAKAQSDERRARQEEGAAMQQLNVLTAQEERRAELGTRMDELNDEISLYNQLREAFGKKGLQAMIIESAIPEVEAEANQLLNRMSEGRMSLRLETQREKVTGGTAETLDIIISDELGPRAYEMFSGGESFRANLALRIAISKLLARRAGAQLQTLVIDEGFGTQDAQGRALLVEAISSIQHDFERVLVVTHIDELKDLFPARIDVVKTADGSRVAIA
jgi:DNA repair protein SbcC/Rad50